jgi:apolipoprotein N-acyltransferase
MGTSYIPFPPWAIFFCFVPLWITWMRATSAGEVFRTGWVTQFVSTLFGFNWVSYTVHEFGHLPWIVSILILLAFSAICTLWIPFAGWVWFHYCKRLHLSFGARIVALVAWSCVGARVFPQIFDWHFGYTWLWAGFPAFQLADTIGFIGFNDIGLVFNGMLLYAWLKRDWRWAGAVVAAFGALNFCGWWHVRQLPVADSKARFLIVQANIENEEKLAAEVGGAFRDTVIGRFANLTAEGVRENQSPGETIDYAVWPETAFPEYIDSRELYGEYPFKLRQMITSWGGVRLITGGFTHMKGGKPSNSFFLLDAKGTWADAPYNKTILLAFGEYFPGAEYFPRVREWFPEVADFGRGPGPTVLSDRNGPRIGAQICYEGLFDWFTRGLANKGAQILVNVTNDSWYGTWEQPWQHLYMTLARAVEVRLPLVRSTNTGISGVVNADGTVQVLSPVHAPWQHAYDVPYYSRPQPTPFMGWCFWALPTLLGLTLVGLPFKYSEHDEPRLG